MSTRICCGRRLGAIRAFAKVRGVVEGPSRALARHAKSLDCRTGLKQQSVFPAARGSSGLIRLLNPVSKMSRVPAMAGSALIARARVKPSISGICTSKSAKSYGLHSVAAARRSFRASAPLAALFACILHARIWRRRISRLVALSSTTSTWKLNKSRKDLSGAFTALACFSSCAVNQKVEPFPCWLCTPI